MTERQRQQWLGYGRRGTRARFATWRIRIVVLLLVSQFMGYACVKQQDRPKPYSRELDDALRHGGLRAAARLVHHYVEAIPIEDHESIAPDIAAMCRSSELAVVAKVVSLAPAPLPDGGKFISTDYSAVVDESFQGPRAKGDALTFRTSGGLIRFPDGTSARQVSGRGLPEIQIGSRYVLFLVREHERDVYAPLLGEQGVFALTDGDRVFSRGRAIDEVFKKYNGMKAADFLSLVRSATRK